MSVSFFAPAARGTAEVLADEIRAFGVADVSLERAGVAFRAELVHAYRVCMWSRVASRVLMPLTAFECGGAAALYEGVRAVDWTKHVHADRTIAVDAVGRHPALSHTRFVSQRTKDAIVDRVRDETGRRPSVDRADPDLRVHVHLTDVRATVSLDLSGPLHRRGIGRQTGDAPLRETLAAALLRLAGWHDAPAGTPLCDPMCGAATLLLEAAWMARDVAPGLLRGRHGFEGWRGHEPAIWAALRADAERRRAEAASVRLHAHGMDESAAVVRSALDNVGRARLTDAIVIERSRLADVVAPPGTGIVVTNPPYGERLGRAGELGPLYEQLGDVLKHRFAGWTAFVLSGSRALDKRVGLKASARHVVYNGSIECRWLRYAIAEQAPSTASGPGWRKAGPDADMLRNRLRKNRRRLGRWAKKQGVFAYRLYDRDMPEYNLAIDWYDGAVRVEERARPRSVDAARADEHLRDSMIVVPEVLGVSPDDVVLRVRARRSADEQHEKRGDFGRMREVRESGLVFLVNLEDYLDTGLFLDDREIRATVRRQSAGLDFLNLFAYTGTASVCAAAGGAKSTTSVDLSPVYLQWARANFERNALWCDAHQLVRADARRWLRSTDRRFGLVLLAPPTYSRSKTVGADFDVQRDHARLVRDAVRVLAPGGAVIFTTNLQGFELDGTLSDLDVSETTALTVPEDFRRGRPHRSYRIGPRRGARDP